MLIGFFCCCFFTNFSQDQKHSDSLKIILKNNTYERANKLGILKDIADNETDTDEIIVYSKELIESAKEMDSVKYLYSGYLQMGNAYRLKSDLTTALENYLIASKIAVDQGLIFEQASIKIAIADAYSIIQNNNNSIKEKNKLITDSIRYAKTIQEAILPAPRRIEETFNDYFIIYKPKDIVSGDFYWFYRDENKVFIATIDCTGHGVSGGFMSMIGNALLSEIISKQKIVEPAQILEKLNEQIKIALKQDEKGNDDGMDVCLCLIDKENEKFSKLTFSGAKRPLYYIKQGSQIIETLKGDTKSVGGKQYKNRSFTEQELILYKGDMIYLTSDGLADQNDINKRKFGSTRLKEILSKNAYLSMGEQKGLLEKALEKHQEGTEQRDDITIVGAKI